MNTMTKAFVLNINEAQIVLHFGTILTEAMLEQSTNQDSPLAKVDRKRMSEKCFYVVLV
jgi:hypothetical protein